MIVFVCGYSVHVRRVNRPVVVIRLPTGQSWVWILAREFFFSKTSGPVLGPTHHPNQWLLGREAVWRWNRLSEADHPPSSSAEVNNKCSYTLLSQHAFMVCTGTTWPVTVLVSLRNKKCLETRSGSFYIVLG